jgi:amino acid transporter
MTGSAGRFLAFWKVLLTAAFSFGNVQVVAIAGSETMNPRKVIPAATQKTFLRVFLFYFLSILIVGMIVSVLSPFLLEGLLRSSDFLVTGLSRVSC